MSPLLIEADECGYTWRSGDGILHRCPRRAGPGRPFGVSAR